VEITFDHIAIYERNMRDWTFCHRHLMYSVEYLAIDGMEMLLACLWSMPFRDYFVSCSGPRWQMQIHLFLYWPLWLFKDGRAMSDRVPPTRVEFIPRRPDDVATSAENQCMQIATSLYVIVSATANCNLSIYYDYWCKILNCA
jgi:hypothetical protein